VVGRIDGEGVVDVEEFDAEEEEAGKAHEDVLVAGWALVVEEWGGNHDNFLEGESEEEDEEYSAFGACRIKIIRKQIP